MDQHQAITVTFTFKTYVITPTAGAGGSIDPSTPHKVPYGGDITFTIAADTGCHVAAVQVTLDADKSVTATFIDTQPDYTLYLPLLLQPGTGRAR